jgi:hypothetical protein
MNLETYFKVNFSRYKSLAPSVAQIQELLKANNQSQEIITNDHIALRTIDMEHVNKEKCAQFFIDQGYQICGEYHFKDKKLKAIHLEQDKYPKVFISELILSEFSAELQKIIKALLKTIPRSITSIELLNYGRKWDISYQDYLIIDKESPYAAWCSAVGYCPNHFTVDIRSLKNFNDLERLNLFLKDNGYCLNASGGEIKGSKHDLLQQSSTLADKMTTSFKDGEFEIPTCYYEFAKRYKGQDGKYFQGFVTQSADKIFESTD